MTPTAEAASDYRERKRLAVQSDISDVAMRLFEEHGFDGTTIEQIAAEVGLSSRSVFRYFASKEDVVLGHLARAGLELHERLVARPLSESPWVALRAAFDASLAQFDDNPESLRRQSRMMQQTPSLRARHLEKQLRWQQLLVPNIAERLGVDDGDAGAHALVASALACLDAATTAWAAADDDRPVREVLDAAIAVVRS